MFVLVCGDNRSCLIGWQVSADDVRAVLGDFEWSFPAVTSQSYSTDVTAFRLTASECASVVPTRHTCRTALASLTSRAWLGSTASQLRQVYDRRKYADAVRWVEIEWLGGRVVSCWTCYQQVAGSKITRRTVECNPGQVVYTHSHTFASVTKQYNWYQRLAM